MKQYSPAGTITQTNLFEFSKPKLYYLFYRGQEVVTNAAYALLQRKEIGLIKNRSIH